MQNKFCQGGLFHMNQGIILTNLKRTLAHLQMPTWDGINSFNGMALTSLLYLHAIMQQHFSRLIFTVCNIYIDGQVQCYGNDV